MSKPFIDEERNSGYFHHSLWYKTQANPNDLNTKRIKKSAFFEPRAATEMGKIEPSSSRVLTEIGRHWLAGLLAHAPALVAIGQPTINCYKRGYENRTGFVRVKGSTEDSIQLESRSPSGCANPYLVLAAHIIAGMDGLKRKLELPSQVGKYEILSTKLPQTLEESLEALKQDTVIQEFFGPDFMKVWIAVKSHEIAQAKANITDYGTPQFFNRIDPWEWIHYFEFL